MNKISRRRFLGQAAAGAAAACAPQASAQADKPSWKIGGFTKILQDLSYEKTAELAAEIGWDGIEVPVRAKGHVLPERVDDDLPRLSEALKSKGLELMVLATDIRAADDPSAEKVLRAAVRAGVRLYRLGPMHYKVGTALSRQLVEFRARLKDLAALNRELGVTGLIQNHSGNGTVGAAIWDIYELIKDLDAGQMGVHFDISHATVECGLSWPTAFSLIQDRVGAIIVKDFYWTHVPGQGGKIVWCPVGQGAVNPKFFGMVRDSRFHGPITMQFEYPIEGGDTLEARRRALKGDHRKLQEWLKA
jgi:sugar phosphate isomerase/epimerase